MTNPTQIKSYYAASIIFDMLSSKAKIMYERVYDNHHSGGMMDVFMELDEELDYLMKIL